MHPDQQPSEELEPPHAIDAERALLSALMHAGDGTGVVAAVRAVLDKQAFYQVDHGIFFDAICRLDDAGQPVDLVSVSLDLAQRQLLQEIGGPAHLGQIFNSHFTAAGAAHYAEQVAEAARLRRVIQTCREIGASALNGGRGEGAEELIQQAIERLTKLQVTGRSTRVRPLGEIAAEVYEQIESGGVPTVRTGFTDIDATTKGVGLGEVMIVGARPSMGKSTLLRQIALRVAKRGEPVGYISLEEGEFKIGRNLLASEADIDNHRLRDATIAADEWGRLSGGVARLASLPFYVCDRAHRMSDIAAVATMMKARYGIRMLIIDYLQMIGGGQGRSRYEQVSYVSQEVAKLIRRLQVAGIVAAQLKRLSERGEAPQPRIDDLKESGQIEQDADMIMLLHREDYYSRGKPGYAQTRLAELLNVKNRDGVCADILIKSVLRYQRFEDADDLDKSRYVPAPDQAQRDWFQDRAEEGGAPASVADFL